MHVFHSTIYVTFFFSFKKTQFYNTELHCLQTHSSSLSFFILKMKLLWQTVHYRRQQAQSFPHSMHHEEKRKMLRSWLLWAYSGIDYYRPSWYLDNGDSIWLMDITVSMCLIFISLLFLTSLFMYHICEILFLYLLLKPWGFVLFFFQDIWCYCFESFWVGFIFVDNIL